MRRNGFTLVEVLIVLAIIAIVAAILFPVIASAKRAARATACLGNMHQIGTAALQYASDNDDAYPFTSVGENIWLGRLNVAHRDPRGAYHSIFKCPDVHVRPDRDEAGGVTGYAYNACTHSRAPASTSRTVMLAETTVLHPLGHPEVYLFTDGLDMPDSYYRDRRPWVNDSLGSRYQPEGEWGAERHQGQGNYVLFDGHAKLVPASAFRLPKAGFFPCESPRGAWLGPANGLFFNPWGAL